MQAERKQEPLTAQSCIPLYRTVHDDTSQLSNQDSLFVGLKLVDCGTEGTARLGLICLCAYSQLLSNLSFHVFC